MSSETMTNEELKGICVSNFELTHYAIALGRYFIKSGRETDVALVLKEMKRHPNPLHVADLKAMDAFEGNESPEEV